LLTEGLNITSLFIAIPIECILKSQTAKDGKGEGPGGPTFVSNGPLGPLQTFVDPALTVV